MNAQYSSTIIIMDVCGNYMGGKAEDIRIWAVIERQQSHLKQFEMRYDVK
jgi:hypothetical protein